MSDLTVSSSFSLTPKSMEEALRFAEILAKSDIVPKDFKGNAGNILVAIQWGLELGLQPMQAMQNIAVINGRPSLWGDAVLALVRASPVFEYIHETIENGTAICRVKRKGEEEQVRTFSEADAKAAGLLGKQGPWSQYRDRMKQMRARSFALRDVFTDVLKGMPIAEEVMDIEERDITPRPQRQDPKAIAQSARPEVEHSDERDQLIQDLEDVMLKQGLESLQHVWAEVLTKEQRKLVGGDELERLKTLQPAQTEGAQP